jgi:hypothetical protein
LKLLDPAGDVVICCQPQGSEAAWVLRGNAGMRAFILVVALRLDPAAVGG